MAASIDKKKSINWKIIFTHLFAVILTSIPTIPLILIVIADPDYLGHIFIPDPKTGYIGFLLGLALILSVFMTYVLSLAFMNTFAYFLPGAKNRRTVIAGIIKLILIGIFIFLCIALALLLGLLGPAAVILFNSPVGKMFSGG